MPCARAIWSSIPAARPTRRHLARRGHRSFPSGHLRSLPSSWTRRRRIRTASRFTWPRPRAFAAASSLGFAGVMSTTMRASSTSFKRSSRWTTSRASRRRRRSGVADSCHLTCARRISWPSMSRQRTPAIRTSPATVVFPSADRGPLHPAVFKPLFSGLVRRAGLRRIRLHDLRQTHATDALRVGVHPKVVSERLGHSRVTITLDTYSHVLPSMQREAAEAVAALVHP